MILLLLVYYIGQATFAGSRPIDGDDTFPPSIAARASSSSCPNAEHCRTTWNILWSCLATIFSCTWVAIHPNILRPVNTREMWLVQRWWHYLWEFLSNRMLLFIIALLVPEYILAWAIRQRLRAQEIARDHKDSNWTVTHGFFVIMGGFHLFQPPSRTPEETGQLLQRASVAEPIHAPHENYKPICMLSEHQLFSPNNEYQFILPTEDQIKDRGKSDWLAKSFVLMQTTWFLTQCIARMQQHLPITELELVTAAYAMMNFATYFFWWKKPLNIGCPVQVIDGQGARSQRTPVTWERRMNLEYAIKAVLGTQDTLLDRNRIPSAPMFWSNCPTLAIISFASTITLLIGLLFGAIHCVAWSFSFPSHTEVILWRFSCTFMILVPFFVSIVGLIAVADGLAGEERLKRYPWFKKILDRVEMPMRWALILCPFLYIFPRVITLVLAFTTLRSLPAAAYETIHWTAFIPHV
ncbi:hypothetical protein DFH09DRAFT_992490 [Mycena vulgaris]|nr:hypothetical protein DFH09DRAFT_992490 [Mycena vulgaris]